MEAAIAAGVNRWLQQSKEFGQELLDNKTPRAIQYRQQIFNELKQKAKDKQA